MNKRSTPRPIRRLEAETRHALARCHFCLADFTPALECLLEAAQIYQDCGDLPGAAAFAGIGICQHRLGAHDDAVASLLRALESARAQKLETLETNIYNSLGSALLAANRVDEAARYIETGIELAQATDNHNLLPGEWQPSSARIAGKTICRSATAVTNSCWCWRAPISRRAPAYWSA